MARKKFDLAGAEASEVRGDLGSLADRLALRSRRAPTNAAARDAAYILFALSDPKFPKAAAWARAAKYHLETNNRGPRSRSREASALRATIVRGLKEKRTAVQIAEAMLKWLRACPLLAVDTSVPAFGAQWPDDEKAKTLARMAAAIQKAIDAGEDDGEIVTKAAMRAVGCPSKVAANLFASEDMRSRRASR